MSANSLSAWEIEQKELPEIYATIINYYRDGDSLKSADTYAVARAIGKSNGDTKPRMTELYQMNWLKITGKVIGTKGQPRSLYALKSPFETPNPIHMTPERKLAELRDKILNMEPDLFAFNELKNYCLNL